jgi:tRNA(fMet)-specific endonuclease VapC
LGVKRLLDTSVLVDILRGDESVAARFRASSPTELVVSAISTGELMTGAALARDTHRELFSVDLLLRPLREVPLDAKTARRAGLLNVMLRRAGTPIGTSDRLIAATALEHDAVVVTSDVRDFMRVPGLIVEDWRAA